MSQVPDSERTHRHPTGKPPRGPNPNRKPTLGKVDWEGWTRDDCWPWRDEHASRAGYSVLRFDGSTINAHRLAYELASGIPPGESEVAVIRHLCGNRSCCNPDHVAPGDPYDNWMDAVRVGNVHGLRRHEVVLIRATYPDLPQSVIADRSGVARQTISKICRGNRHRQRTG